MELTETERSMLTKKQEEICRLTLLILRDAKDPEKEEPIKENFTSIIALLNQIAAAYSRTGHDLSKVTISINMLFLVMNDERLHKTWIASPITIEIVCNFLNSVRFQFVKSGIKITLPK